MYDRVSINNMLVLQLKLFLSVNLCFHFDSSRNLAFISHFDSVDARIIQMLLFSLPQLLRRMSDFF